MAKYHDPKTGKTVKASNLKKAKFSDNTKKKQTKKKED